MNELETIVANAKDRPGALLETVVRVEGSSYRRPRAHMLMTGDALTGCVSGGCLEADVARRGEFLVRAGQPVVVTYDSTAEDDDIAWGVGLGCNGVVEVMIERLSEEGLDPVGFARECFEANEAGVLVTIFRGDGLGSRVALRKGGMRANVPAMLEATLVCEAHSLLARLDGPGRFREKARVVTIGGMSALVEPIVASPMLYAIGAGHDVVPLVDIARASGLRVTVAMPDARFANRFASADRVLVGAPDAIARAARGGCAVVMTHSFERDRDILAALLAEDVPYVGVLGPKKRTERILRDIGALAGQRLHAPVGLDLGAETPQEIALSIVAEVRSFLAGASGHALRHREGAIHAAAE